MKSLNGRSSWFELTGTIIIVGRHIQVEIQVEIRRDGRRVDVELLENGRKILVFDGVGGGGGGVGKCRPITIGTGSNLVE